AVPARRRGEDVRPREPARPGRAPIPRRRAPRRRVYRPRRSSGDGRLRLTDLGHRALGRRALTLGALWRGDLDGAGSPRLVHEEAAGDVVAAILAEEALV